jgi:hypothetical protein
MFIHSEPYRLKPSPTKNHSGAALIAVPVEVIYNHFDIWHARKEDFWSF